MGGQSTVIVSSDFGVTWQSTEVITTRVQFLRYANNLYYMGIYNSSSSPQYAILTSSDGVTFTDINATVPNIYGFVYDSGNGIFYGKSSSSNWVSGPNIGEMTTVSGVTMYGDKLCRFSNSYPLGVMGFNDGSNYLNKIYVTRDCLTSSDSLQTFPEINGNSFYTYHPLESSATNTNITAIMRVNGNYYLGELQNYYGTVSPSTKIPSQYCLPNYSSSGTYTLKVVNGVIQWVSG